MFHKNMTMLRKGCGLSSYANSIALTQIRISAIEMNRYRYCGSCQKSEIVLSSAASIKT
jgi:hypothetical protein